MFILCQRKILETPFRRALCLLLFCLVAEACLRNRKFQFAY